MDDAKRSRESPFIMKHFSFLAPLMDSRRSRKSFFFLRSPRTMVHKTVRRWKLPMTMKITCYHLMQTFVFGFDGLFISMKLKEKIKQLRQRFSRRYDYASDHARDASITTYPNKRDQLNWVIKGPFTVCPVPLLTCIHYIIESDLDEGYMPILHCLFSHSRYQLNWIFVVFRSLRCHAKCFSSPFCFFNERVVFDREWEKLVRVIEGKFNQNYSLGDEKIDDDF